MSSHDQFRERRKESVNHVGLGKGEGDERKESKKECYRQHSN